VLHFAAHALIDEESPGRSAILLAAGADGEDGLLQAREVLDLDLQGALITLSACQSAGGRIVAGEGVMGLARSFFQARAAAVVGGLWPLRDEETAALMELFYGGVAEGMPVGAAMTRAKRSLQAAGAPASAWAGVVVLGRGDLVPWPAVSTAKKVGPLEIAAAILLAVGLALFIRRIPRRRA
jgi:CHAT domain-containing protein